MNFRGLKMLASILAVGVVSAVSVFGQAWSGSIGIAEGDKLDDIIRKGETWFREHNITSGPEWKDFHRWVERARTRVDEQGRFYPDETMRQSFRSYAAMRTNAVPSKRGSERTLSQQTAANAPSAWVNIAPSIKESRVGGNQYHVGAGRVNCVRFHPSNASIMYIGTAGGGVWKTTNGGVSWAPLMDDEYSLPVLEIKDVAVHPNGSTLYALASGTVNISGGSGGTSTLWNCLYKSTNGGSTWTTDSIGTTQGSNSIYWRRLVLDPLRPDTLYIAGSGSSTTAGVYRSYDGGESWTQLQDSTQSYDIATATKGDTTYVYTAWVRNDSTIFCRFQHTSNGVTSTSYTLRTGAPCDGAYITTGPGGIVYVLTLDSNGSYDRLSRSTNYGSSFSTVTTTVPPVNGSGVVIKPGGGSFEACPTTTNTLYLGGAVLCRSADGGKTWETISITESGLSQLHVDHNDIEFHPSSSTPVVFDGNDCGVYKIEEVAAGGGTDYTLSYISNGLEALQCYRLGVGRSAAHIVMLGTHDNGSYKFDINADIQKKMGGGDGQEGMVDHDDANILYWSSQNGSLSRSSDGGATTDAVQSVTGAAWTAPFIMDHDDPETLYVATTTFLRSINRGGNWTSVGGSFASNIYYLVQAQSNASVFYAATNTTLYYSTDGGASWTTATKPSGTGNFTDLAIDPTNPAVVYATFSGYNSARVFRSANYGTSWTNVSTGLPALPAHSMVLDPRRPTEAYISLEYGVWYNADVTSPSSSWEDYAGDLPNVAALELEIHADSQTLYAATSGRGLWKTPMKHTSDAAAGYCTPQGTTIDYNTGIVKAQLIDNATGDTLMTVSSQTNGGYTRYDTPQPVLRQGQSYSLHLTFAGGSWLQQAHVWADWNRDGVFQHTDSVLTAEDSTWNDYEDIGSAVGISPLNPVRVFTFTVPADSGYVARPGASYLRVGADWTQSSSDISPCGLAEYGEYEDYAISIDYCRPVGNASYNIGTTRVTMKLLPTLNTTVLDQSSTALAAYSDYTGSPVSVIRGRNYRLTLTGATATTQKVSVFIDWNADGDFADAGEVVANQATLSTTASLNITVSVPLTFVTSYRMRVMSDSANSPVTLAPCTNPLRGEVEDYKLVPLTQSIVSVGEDKASDEEASGNSEQAVGVGEPGAEADVLFRLSPNPVEQSTVFIDCMAPDTGEYEFLLADLFGREIQHASYVFAKGVHRVELPVPQAGGVYLVVMKYRGEILHSGRIVVR